MLHTWRDLGYHAQCRQNSNIKGTLLQLQRQKLGDVTVNTSERPASGYLLSPCTHITIPSLNTITTIFSLHLAPNIIAAHLEWALKQFPPLNTIQCAAASFILRHNLALPKPCTKECNDHFPHRIFTSLSVMMTCKQLLFPELPLGWEQHVPIGNLVAQGKSNLKVPHLIFQPTYATCSCVPILGGAAGSPTAPTADLLPHSWCWQQLHPHTIRAHGQGCVAAAFATWEHRARGW